MKHSSLFQLPLWLVGICIMLLTVEGFSVTALGSGVGEDLSSAQNSALKGAVRNYLKNILTKEEYQKNRVLLQSRVINNYKSLITSSILLSEEEHFGVNRVSVEADVSEKAVRDALIKYKVFDTNIGKPRVVVLLDERVQNKPSFEKTATFAFEKTLLDQGYKVVEAEQLEKIKEIAQMSEGELASLAFRSGADLLIKGSISVGKGKKSTTYGIEHYTAPIQMNTRVVRAYDAEIVAARQKRVKKKASDEFEAAQMGLQYGGQQLAKLLTKDLNSYWINEAYGQQSITLMAEAEGALLDQMIANFRMQKSVRDINLRYIEGKSAILDVTIRGTIQEFREAILKHKKWKITALSRQQIAIAPANRVKSDEIDYDYIEPDLSITGFTVENIFPSRLHYYEKNPSAKVTLKVKAGSRVKDVKVGVFIPTIMDLPSETQMKSLSEGSENSVDLTLLMNENKLLKVRTGKKVTAQATLTFYLNGKEVTRKLTAPVMVHDVNGMDWNEMESIGSFVTYKNSTIDRFARTALTSLTKRGFNDQFEEAVAIYTALKELGVTYIKDPATVAGVGLDKVQYPVETLDKRSGDCDDSSVLMAALLAAVGINTAFIVYPDHVLIMFDTGIFKKNLYKLGVTENSVVIHNDHCWIPVETTLLKKDFIASWKAAAQEFQQAVADGKDISIVELDSAWKRFQPFRYSQDLAKLKTKDINEASAEQMTLVENQLKKSLQRQIVTLEKKATRSAEEDLMLGTLYARAKEYTKATKYLKKLVSHNPSAQTLNNYGCALILQGDEKKGLQQIEKSLQKGQTSEAMVNKALCYYLMSDTKEGVDNFIVALKEAQEQLPDGVRLDDLLGLDLAPKEGSDRASDGREAQTKQTVSKSRLKELIRKRVLSRDMSGTSASTETRNIMPFGGVRGADPTQVALVADLLNWMK